MLKSVATYLVSRLMLLAVVAMALNAYPRSSCRPGDAPGDLYGQLKSAMDEISRAFGPAGRP